MEFYDFKSQGKIFIEVLNHLPIWKTTDTGRLIFDSETDCMYIGGNTYSISWIPILPMSKSINSKHINWDVNLDDVSKLKVNALSIPCIYNLSFHINNSVWNDNKNVINNVQNAITDLRNGISKILDGKYYADSSIKYKHIDRFTSDGLKATNILINNDKLYFGSPDIDISIEQALEILHLRRADSIYMAIDNKFGSKLNIFSNTVQDSFEGIEQYLSTLSANQIFATMPPSNIGCSSDININTVQCALDRLFNELNNLRFIDLKDVSREMLSNQVLKSCISRNQNDSEDLDIRCRTNNITYQIGHWEFLWASEVKTKYPDIDDETNVQAIFWLIYEDIKKIKEDIEKIKKDIIEIKEKIRYLIYEFIKVKNDFVYIKNDIEDLKLRMKNIKTDLKYINDEVPIIELQVIKLKNISKYIRLFCCKHECEENIIDLTTLLTISNIAVDINILPEIKLQPLELEISNVSVNIDTSENTVQSLEISNVSVNIDTSENAAQSLEISNVSVSIDYNE